MLHRRVRAFGCFVCAAVLFSSPAFARSVTIAWDPNPETDIAGYIVYRGATCGSYTTTADAGNQTMYTFASLPDAEAHCFAVQAYNRAGQRGPLSDTVSMPAPAAPAASNPLIVIDLPTQNARVSQPFALGGWAADLGSTSGPGIDMLHVYAYPAGGGAPIFIGLPSYGHARPDVAAAYGTAFTNSGYGLPVSNLAAGDYQIVVFPHSTVAGTFTAAATRAISVLPAPIMNVDWPAAGTTVSQPFAIDGWAIDQGATAGTGIDAVNAFAYPNPGSGAAPIFLGWASYGRGRPDVGAAYGARFTNAGFQVPVDGLAPGTYMIDLYSHSTATNRFGLANRFTIDVKGRPKMNIDVPAQDGVVGRSFRVAGWALDLESASGAGVDAVHVYAYPAAGGGPTLLGVATLGVARPDVAAAFASSRFTDSGFNLDAALTAPGVYDLVVFARSTVTGTFNNAQVRRVTVQ